MQAIRMDIHMLGLGREDHDRLFVLADEHTLDLFQILIRWKFCQARAGNVEPILVVTEPDRADDLKAIRSLVAPALGTECATRSPFAGQALWSDI